MPNTALFFNVPGHGHVNPSLPLVKELSLRGHRITYFITPAFQKQVEAAGAVFRPYESIGDDYFGEPGLDGSRPLRAAYTLMKTSEEILPELLEAARRLCPDYILFDGMCPWGFWVARILKLPAVSSLALLQIGNPPPSIFLKNPQLLRLFLSVMTRDTRLGLEAGRISRRIGERYAASHLGPTEILNAAGDLTLSYTSWEFQPFKGGLPPSIRFVGRSQPDPQEGDPGLFEPVHGRPLIYISLGSLINRNRDFFKMCAEAFAGRDEYVMITTGHGVQASELGPLPENVAVHPWLPQAAVLGRAALFISHGGLNSIHDGLLFGVPMLFVPQQTEQTINASRAVELGAGLMLPAKNLSRESLRASTDRLLKEESFKVKAERLGDGLRAAGGIPAAADLVEELLKGATSPRSPVRP